MLCGVLHPYISTDEYLYYCWKLNDSEEEEEEDKEVFTRSVT